MRDYASFSSSFWTGETGRKLHGDPAAQVLAAYLINNRHSNLIGLYYLPLIYVAHETGLSDAVVLAALAKLEVLEFCRYDRTTEYVWVRTAARRQTTRSPKAIAGAKRELARTPKGTLRTEFERLYGSDLSRLHTVSIGYPAPENTVSVPDPSELPRQEQDRNKTGTETGVRAREARPPVEPDDSLGNDLKTNPPPRVELEPGEPEPDPQPMTPLRAMREAWAVAAKAAGWVPTPELLPDQLRRGAKRAEEYAAATRSDLPGAALALARSAFQAARALGKAPALALLDCEPGKAPQRGGSGRPRMAPATTHEDFADAAPLEDQLRKFGGG